MSNALPEVDLASQELKRAYLDLLKKCLTMWLWEAHDGAQKQAPDPDLQTKAKQFVKKLVGKEEAAPAQLDHQTQRLEGRDWPVLAHTMIGMKRMDNLQYCVEDVLAKGVPGDLIETGVWRGGATILMRGILMAYAVRDRRVWVADSFAGLPPPDPGNYPEDRDSIHHEMTPLAVSLDQVKGHFQSYGLLDDQVCFLKGWFKDTLPTAPIVRLAVARLDGDMYESTMDGLTHLYPKLSPGGYLIVDDYGAVPACQRAVADYRKAHDIREPIQTIDWTGVFWQRAFRS